MAEGGGDFGYDDPDLDHNLDNDDDLIDFDSDEEVDTTRPFQPATASPPYHGGEQHEMQTMRPEQSGLPSYDESTPFLAYDDLSRRLGELKKNSITGLLDTSKIPDSGINPLSEKDKEEQIKRVKRLIKARYPNANVDKLVIGYSRKKPMDLVVKGPRGGETKILLSDGSGLQKSFINASFIRKELGPPAENIIKEDRNTAQEQRQRLKEAEKQLKEAEEITAELEKEEQEVQDLQKKTDMVQAKIDAIQEDQGSNLENEAELRRLKQLKKNHQTELENKKKELSKLEKQAKNKEKLKEKVFRETKKLNEVESKKNAMEEKLNSTKALDELKKEKTISNAKKKKSRQLSKMKTPRHQKEMPQKQ